MWLLTTMDSLSAKLLEMVPIYRKLEIIHIQIFDEVIVETNDFLNLVWFDPQRFKLILH